MQNTHVRFGLRASHLAYFRIWPFRRLRSHRNFPGSTCHFLMTIWVTTVTALHMWSFRRHPISSTSHGLTHRFPMTIRTSSVAALSSAFAHPHTSSTASPPPLSESAWFVARLASSSFGRAIPLLLSFGFLGVFRPRSAHREYSSLVMRCLAHRADLTSEWG